MNNWKNILGLVIQNLESLFWVSFGLYVFFKSNIIKVFLYSERTNVISKKILYFLFGIDSVVFFYAAFWITFPWNHISKTDDSKWVFISMILCFITISFLIFTLWNVYKWWVFPITFSLGMSLIFLINFIPFKGTTNTVLYFFCVILLVSYSAFF